MSLPGLALLAALAAVAPADTPRTIVQDIRPGVWMISNPTPEGREPDGNTIIWQAPRGLIVMDTGRHPWRHDAILAFARAHRQPIAAVINSHWHLDHVEGNPAIRAAYPRVRVYASGAIDGAIAGFPKRSPADGQAYLDKGGLPPSTQEDVRLDIAAYRAADGLKPDERIERSRAMVIAGRRLGLNLARDAATAGDVWVYDPTAQVVAAGDLVTLPAPFLDTACPQGWRRALEAVAATRFVRLLPGHGQAMDRTAFETYRHAFTAFVDCAGSARPKAECAAGWRRDAGSLLAAAGMDGRQAEGLAGYYVEMLRTHGGKSTDCAAA